MLSVNTAHELAELIALFLAYLLAIAPAGWLRAWMARHFGDDTAYEWGLETINPLAHIDVLGLIFLLLPRFRFGWGKNIPVNPAYIRGRYPTVNYLITLFSNTFVHWIVATVTLVALIALLGPGLEEIRISSWSMACVHVLVKCASLSLWLAVVTFVINVVTFGLHSYDPYLVQSPLVMWYYVGAYLILIFIIGENVGATMIHTSSVVGMYMARFFGLLPYG